MPTSKHCIGVMQGRLSEPEGDLIQSFPSASWQSEFPKAERLGLRYIEWTIDHSNFWSNPIFVCEEEIRALNEAENGVRVQSITCDFVMHRGQLDSEMLFSLSWLMRFGSHLGISLYVVPLVDQTSVPIDSVHDVKDLFLKIDALARQLDVKVLFESDLSPENLSAFIEELPEDTFGINYDSGNSASLGYHPSDEFDLYGHRIKNIHIKDRMFGGETVRLGLGDVDFGSLFSSINRVGYNGALILQAARVDGISESELIAEYVTFVNSFLNYRE